MVITPIVSTAPTVSAANRLFISELRVETGEEAVAKLEADGWSVTMVGLNVTADPASQVYLAYKVNTGAALTNVIVSPDVGDSFKDKNGIVYNCVSHVDVDEGIGGGAGCLYATTDERIGSPLVGIDVLRGNSESDDVLYPITNDGAEIVRTPSGTPADIEKGSETDVVYLAQIRDGIIRPYISEIGIVTDTDKWNAVYTACERGFNYYIEGDIDSSSGTYTIIGYDRTANASEAITNITAVSANAVKALEDAQIVDGSAEKTKNVTAAAISISGIEYARVSSKPVEAKEPYYIYMTKDKKAGNPISMLYAETPDQAQNFLFGTWANAYFFSPGKTTAYTYSMNEDLYETLWEDQTVCSQLPVRLIDSFTATASTSTGTATATTATGPNYSEESAEEPTTEEPSVEEPSVEEPSAEEPSVEEPSAEEPSAEEPSAEELSTEEPSTEEPSAEEPSAEEPSAEEPSAEEPSTEEPSVEEPSAAESSAAESSAAESSKPAAAAEIAGSDKYIDLTMLTPRDGLPDTAPSITGMRSDPSLPFVERTQRSERTNKFQASVFGSSGLWVLIPVGVLVIAGTAYIFYKKRSESKAAETPNKTVKSAKTGKSDKPNSTNKSKKTNKSNRSKKKR